MPNPKYTNEEIDSILYRTKDNKIEKASVIFNDLYEVVNHGMLEKLISIVTKQNLPRSEFIKTCSVINELAKKIELDLKEFRETPLESKTRMFRMANFLDVKNENISKSTESNIILSGNFRKTKSAGCELATNYKIAGGKADEINDFLNLTKPVRKNFKVKYNDLITEIFSSVNEHKLSIEKQKNKLKIGSQ